MDAIFSIFLETLGAPIASRPVPPSAVEHYQGKLPNQLLEYWKEHGWCGYGGGLFWLVDPREYEGVVDAWVGGNSHDTYHLIARSAFGELYLWGEKTGSMLTIAAYHSRYFISAPSSTDEERDNKIQSLLMWAMTENIGLDLFDEARETLGDLQANEMYGFVPALMLGGSATLDRLQRLDAEVHLIILSQLANLEPYELDEEEDE
ncbi:GAD-like domain-containing protein [Pseudomonas sp. PSKL.D1]|uniref:GAD-like domain-containing protein n=1 Tax=Pseudomonas sp. PSKL.D1 TaxID=3029060 RepID=UPI0023812B98|nr:GAD-like domain-containing protein [Pseudomonas sp. PSKL.D1]WDY59601.1 GAD-like domain-containing protein [Pseudomonas sp. PSKL.D1]